MLYADKAMGQFWKWFAIKGDHVKHLNMVFDNFTST